MNQPIDPHFDSLVPGRDVSRRGFIVTSLGAGFAAAVLPVSAQTMIVTSDGCWFKTVNAVWKLKPISAANMAITT